MKRVVIVLAILLCGVYTPAFAADCSKKICVSVVTDPATGRIIITAVQNRPGSTSTPTPKPTVKRVIVRKVPAVIQTRKPKIVRPIAPKPAAPRVKVTRKATPSAKRTVQPKVVAEISLSDQLTQLLPTSHILYSPNTGALVQVPENFWSSALLNFSTTSLILGISVGVVLTPTFSWDFGDGEKISSSNSQRVTHFYKKSGTYTVALSISWSGTWSAELNIYPVLGGAILQNYTASIIVAQGPTKYSK